MQVGGGASGCSEDPLLIPGRDGSLYAYITSTGMLKVCRSYVACVVRVSCARARVCVCVVRVAHVCVCVCGCVRQKLPSSIKDMVNNSPFLAADGTLFVGSKDSQIFTLELDTGSLASVHSTKGLSTQLVPTDPDDDEKNANQVSSCFAFLAATPATTTALVPSSPPSSSTPVVRHADGLHGAGDQSQERRGAMECHRERVHL